MPVAIEQGDGIHQDDTWKDKSDATTYLAHDVLCAVLWEATELEGPANLRNFRDNYFHLLSEHGTLRDYELLGVLGRGAHGQVILGRRKVEADLVAIKKISKQEYHRQLNSIFIQEEHTILRLAQEGKSRWLLPLIESFQTPDYVFMVMPYIPGGSLIEAPYRSDFTDFTLQSNDDNGDGDEGREGRLLTMDSLRFYLGEVLLALEELHSLGFIHRDVKPDNVLIGADGHIKLIDYSCAADIRHRSNGKASCKTAIGTADYIAPEVLAAQSSKAGSSYGVEADLWSFGVCLYELLTGELPFYSESLLHTYNKIQNHTNNLSFDHPRITPEAKDLLTGLLCDHEKRLSVSAIKEHPFFSGFSWNSVNLPPYIPLEKVPDDLEPYTTPLANPYKTTKRSFDGFHLPFVGLTWKQPKTHVESTPPSGNQTEEQLLVLKSQISQLQSAATLDKLKIAELVRKLEELMIAKGYGQSTSTAGPSTRDDKKMLREQRQQILKLEQQLQQERRLNAHLHAEIAEIKALKSAAESTFEDLRIIDDGSSLFSIGSSDRRSSIHSKLKSLMKPHAFSFGASTGGKLEDSAVKILSPGHSQWTKVKLSLCDTGVVMANAKCLFSINCAALWIQRVRREELPKLKESDLACCFKVRHAASLLNTPGTPNRSYDPRNMAELSRALQKELKLREGALSMSDAATTPETKSRIQLQIEESSRRIDLLEAKVNRLQMTEDSLVGPGAVDHSSEAFNHSYRKLLVRQGDCQVCRRDYAQSQALVECERCHVQCHRECSPLLMVRCEEVSSLSTCLPVYIWTKSKDEAKTWMHELEHQRRLHLLSSL